MDLNDWAKNYNFMVIHEWSRSDNAERVMALAVAYAVWGQSEVLTAIEVN